MDTINNKRVTIKIGRKAQEQLKADHAAYIGRTGKVISFQSYCDMMLTKRRANNRGRSKSNSQ